MTKAAATSSQPPGVSLGEAARVWARIGLLSFGGPAGQIAMMHKELVEKRRWIGEARFLHALNYCMLLPGPEAQQLATYIGWLMHRTAGGLVAGGLFVLPGMVTMLALSALYATFSETPAVAALFFGLKAAVLAVVIEALHRISKRALRTRLSFGIAGLAFVAIFALGVPFPLIIVCASVIGLWVDRFAPGALPAAAGAEAADAAPTIIDAMEARGELAHTRPSMPRAARVLVVCLLSWWVPIALLALAFGTRSVFVTQGVFFSQTAVVTFGGAYAVLAFIAQEGVETYGWLRPGEMLDGLGLAETTPGPLILVVQFVAFLGAYRNPGGLSPIAAGVLGSLVTIWVTFVPCFLWILLGAPYIEALRGNRTLHAALSSITAAVVGVILNLSVWFGIHVLFGVVDERHLGPLRYFRPDLASIDVRSLGLSVLAIVLVFKVKVGLPKTLATCAAAGVALKLLT